MNNLRILGPNDLGKGILIEYDAGHINPNDEFNRNILKENKNLLDHSKPCGIKMYCWEN